MVEVFQVQIRYHGLLLRVWIIFDIIFMSKVPLVLIVHIGNIFLRLILSTVVLLAILQTTLLKAILAWRRPHDNPGVAD